MPPAAGIQPCGFLLALSTDWRIGCASENLGDFLGVDAATALGRPFADLFDSQAVHAIRNRVALLREEESPERLLELPLVEGGSPFDLAVRLSRGSVILEALPATDAGGIDVAATVARMTGPILAAETASAVANAAAVELRGLTGFDSIAIYKLAGESSECMAHCARTGAEAFGEIELSAGALERPRWIADANASAAGLICSRARTFPEAAGLLAPADPATGSALRATGAAAAVVLPIPSPAGAWGYALALHRSPRAPRLARLSAAEVFVQMLGLKIQVAG